MANDAIEVKFSGMNKLAANLRKLEGDMRRAGGQALREEAEIEMLEAKERTPVDFGTLKSSGHVTAPIVEGRDVTVKLVFGGAASEYAVYVHENLDAFHKVGQAKFLESVLVESAPYFADRVARRMRGLIK